MEVGGLFAVPTWHLFIRRNPGFILFIMPSLGPNNRGWLSTYQLDPGLWSRAGAHGAVARR